MSRLPQLVHLLLECSEDPACLGLYINLEVVPTDASAPEFA